MALLEQNSPFPFVLLAPPLKKHKNKNKKILKHKIVCVINFNNFLIKS